MLGISPTRIGFNGVGALGKEELKGSGPGGGDKEVKNDLDDEFRSLLESLNAWREKVAVGELPGIPGLFCSVELNYSIF